MPPRTQSAASRPLPQRAAGVAQRVAALLHRLRSPGGSCVAAAKASIWCATPSVPSRWLSASLKCVTSEISSTCGSALSRTQADRGPQA